MSVNHLLDQSSHLCSRLFSQSVSPFVLLSICHSLNSQSHIKSNSQSVKLAINKSNNHLSHNWYLHYICNHKKFLKSCTIGWQIKNHAKRSHSRFLWTNLHFSSLKQLSQILIRVFLQVLRKVSTKRLNCQDIKLFSSTLLIRSSINFLTFMIMRQKKNKRKKTKINQFFCFLRSNEN